MSKSKADAKKRRTFVVFTIPGFLLYSAFFIFPILMGAYYSLTDWDGVKKKFNMIGMQNYVKIFQDKQFINALGFTLKYSLFLIILTIILAVCLALFLNQSVKGRGFFRSMYFIPAVLSMLTVGLIFNQIFYYILPPIGKALGNPTLSKSLLSSPRMAIWAILFVNLWQGPSDPDAVDSGRFTVHPHGFAGSRLFRRSQGFSEISVYHGSVYFAGAQCRVGPDAEGWPDGL